MKRHFFRWFLVAVIMVVVASPTQVLAQSDELQSLANRLDRLERDINTVNIQLSRGKSPKGAPAAGVAGDAGAAGTPAIARMELRLTELESEVRAATGKAEEVVHQLSQINRRLDKLISDMDYRLGSLEGTSVAAPGGSPSHSMKPAAPTAESSPPPGQASKQSSDQASNPETIGTITQSELTATQKQGESEQQKGQKEEGQKETSPQTAKASTGVLPAGSPKDRYIYAFKLLRQSKYDEAETALREFLESHGEDELAGNARYWLGETFYVRNDYRSAAQTFIEGYRKNPKSAKAPDTLMKLGMSLAKLDKKNEACAAFSKLAKDFPTIPSSMAKIVEKEREIAGCK